MTLEKITTYYIGNDKQYTPNEAAKILKIDSSLVRRYCRQGRLGTLYGKVWLITEADLERFKQQPRKVGNPDFGPGYSKK